MRGWLKRTLVGVGVGLLAIQLVPYGHAHAARPVVAEPTWSSPEVRALAKRACFDCHSNETRWPWYSNVAPVSWLVQHDVDEGREELDYSEWHGPTKASNKAAEEVREGEMPPAIYQWMHPEARLSAQEREQLARGLASGAAPGPANERAEGE